MRESTSEARFSFNLSIAFGITAVVGLLPNFIYPRSAVNVHTMAGALTVVAALAYVILGTSESILLRRLPAAERLAGYFAVQIGLFAALGAATRLRGMVVIAAFPLVSQAIALLPKRMALGVAILLYAVVLTVAFASLPRQDALWSALSVLSGFFFVIAFTRLAVREKEARAQAERLQDELRAANRQLCEQAGRNEELARVQERNRLAREIHDSLGHYLTTVAVQLEAAQALHAREPERALADVAKAHALAREALVEVRRSVGALRADLPPVKPLAERIQELATAEAGVRVQFSIKGAVRPLSTEIEHGLFRAVQEGLTNARKHARAREVSVTLDYRDEKWTKAEIADDGQGCENLRLGFGLNGLRERMALLGGACDASARVEGGFRLRVEVPA